MADQRDWGPSGIGSSLRRHSETPMGTSHAGCGASTGAAVGEQRAQCPARRAARAGCRALRTAHSWRGVLPFTHLAREGRMTVSIGRREYRLDRLERSTRDLLSLLAAINERGASFTSLKVWRERRNAACGSEISGRKNPRRQGGILTLQYSYGLTASPPPVAGNWCREPADCRTRFMSTSPL